MNKKIASAEFPEDDSFWASFWAGFAAGIYPIVYFAHLTAQIIYECFKKFAYLLVENNPSSFQDREYLAFTVWKGMDSGSYQIVLGIFDNKNKKLCDARVIQADSVDSLIKQAHGEGKKKIAFWQ
ncbi:hypothetical protein [Phormidium nigroviride]